MTTLEKIRAEIAEYGSIWVQYYIKGHTDTDIDKLVEDVLQQAKSQVLAIIDKYAEQEPRTWNNHQVACLLADMFDDSCACNYNGIDEWLPELCDFKDTCCPKPVGVACWEQFLKHTKTRYCECGYEMR